MEPKITVIVPVYNVEKYLPECLDSLACQTYKNLQVLVVNDGSTDSSPQVIEDYVRRFPDRFAQLNKPNGGLSDAAISRSARLKANGLPSLTATTGLIPSITRKWQTSWRGAQTSLVSDIEYFYENGQPSWIMPGLNPHAFDSPVKQAFLSPMFAWNKLYRADFFTQKHYRYPVGTWYEDIPVTIPIFAQSQNDRNSARGADSLPPAGRFDHVRHQERAAERNLSGHEAGPRSVCGNGPQRTVSR